ncbi:hypothetical protein KC19_7G002100 [Ceratodon purpureus]|uniref:Uncharacterized protein n=1 Tax=Ceratodon purpureus TaxID=3225 RepID=A0A8T0H4G5_CERPU|nr:hypothetical protein KC19_7G002100 [Ceratodon purpureus]
MQDAATRAGQCHNRRIPPRVVAAPGKFSHLLCKNIFSQYTKHIIKTKIHYIAPQSLVQPTSHRTHTTHTCCQPLPFTFDTFSQIHQKLLNTHPSSTLFNNLWQNWSRQLREVNSVASSACNCRWPHTGVLFQFRKVNSKRISKLVEEESCLLPSPIVNTLNAHQPRQIKKK